jgi:hypothetical protein
MGVLPAQVVRLFMAQQHNTVSKLECTVLEKKMQGRHHMRWVQSSVVYDPSKNTAGVQQDNTNTVMFCLVASQAVKLD